MLFPVQQAKARLDWHKRRLLLGVAGLVMLKIGAAFLVAAIWLVLAAEFSPVIATLVCAALFFGAGLVVLALRGARPKPEAPSLEERAQADGRLHRTLAHPALLEALLFGVSVYREVRRGRK
jgi:hypothetical protein